MRKGAGIWAWIGENSGALLVAGAVLGGFWAAGGSLATNEDVERATRDLATRGDLAGLATRADLDTTERTVNTLRETVASLASTVDGLNSAAETVNRTVETLRENVERTNETVAALSATVDTTSETVTRLSGTVEVLGRSADALEETIPLLVSCVIDLHLWTMASGDRTGERQPLPESCEQARRQ